MTENQKSIFTFNEKLPPMTKKVDVEKTAEKKNTKG